MLAATSALASVADAAPQSVCQAVKLTASDPDNDDRYGQAVALDGDVALIGAFKHDDLGANSGAAYVARCDGTTWSEEQKLLASDGASQDRFGWSVALHGAVAVVGAREDDDLGAQSGSAYVFRFDGTSWVQEQKLTASDGQADDEFGTWCAVHDDVAVIGAPFEDQGGVDAGAAYVFRFDGTTWNEEQKLLASDAEAGDTFGTSLSVVGAWLIVGAPLEGSAGSSAGAAYVFRGSVGSWTQFAKLVGDTVDSNDRFGYAVSLSGNAALVGAFNDEPAGPSSGSAFVFRFDGVAWQQEQRLGASDGAAVDTYGWSVALDGDLAVIGARTEDAGGADSGAAYLYRFDGSAWGAETKFIGDDTAAQDSFAYAIALDADRVLAGAWADDDVQNGAGSAYVFVGASGADCDADGTADACEILAGAPDADGDGLPDACEAGVGFCFGTNGACPCANGGGAGSGCDNAQATGGVALDAAGDPSSGGVTLLGSGFPASSAPTVVAIRASAVEDPPLVFGDGLRCIGLAGLVRIGSGTAGGGTIALATSDGAGPGTFRYQLWYRNTPSTFCDAGAAFNLSNGLAITWP